MSRQVYLLGVGIALVALTFAVTDWAVRPPFESGVTEVNARRVCEGMTLEQVEAILGVFSGDLLFAGRRVDRMGLKAIFAEPDFPAVALRGPAVVRKGEEGFVTVFFRGDGRVQRVEWRSNGPHAPRRQASSPTPLARLRAWLGW